MKSFILSISFSFSFILCFAQHEMGAFTATGRGVSTTFVRDYQAIGINPSNLGWAPKYDGKKMALGFLEGAYSIHSPALTKADLRESIREVDSANFTLEDKLKAAAEFTNEGLAINADANLLGIGVYVDTVVGGFAVGIRERVQWYSKMNSTMSEIMFMGYNAPYFDQKLDQFGNITTNPDSVVQALATVPKLFTEIFDSSRMSLSWMREFNLSYGRQLFRTGDIAIYGGAGIKYVSGIAMIDMRIEDGNFDGFSAITPFLGIEYGDSVEAANPTTIEKSGNLPQAAGNGIGYDFGVSAVIKDKLRIGAAITDIGSINWNGNVYKAKDDFLNDITADGVDGYNIFDQASTFSGDEGLFEWGAAEARKVNLPTTLRLGASFAPGDILEFGADAIIPMNDNAGNYENALVSFGLDVKPVPWVRFSTGFASGGNYGFNIPIGILFIAGEGTWEAGIASRDVYTFFAKEGPTLSASLGFLRFRF